MLKKIYYNMEQPVNHGCNKQTCMIAIPARRDSSLQKNSKNYVKKLSSLQTVCKGDMSHHKPKTAKIILGMNLGLYLLPLQCEPFWILVKLKHGNSVCYMSTTAQLNKNSYYTFWKFYKMQFLCIQDHCVVSPNTLHSARHILLLYICKLFCLVQESGDILYCRMRLATYH